MLEHSNYPEKVHAYAAKIAPNAVDKDELTLAQAQNLKPELQFEWPLWLDVIITELTSLVVTSNVLELMMYLLKGRIGFSIY